MNYNLYRAARSLLVGAMVAVGVSFLPGYASAATGDQIAVVDVERIVADSIMGKAARNTVEAEAKKGQAKLEQLKSDYDRERAALQKQASLLSGSALDEKKDLLAKKERDFMRVQQDLQESLMRKNSEQIGKVVSEVQEIVKTMAKDRNNAFVLERDKQFVIYVNPQIDITDEVIKELDKKKIAL